MAYMPNFGERAALVFNQAKPRELPRFFKALERLFVRAKVTDEGDMKEDALMYVEYEVEQIWKTFPEYKDITKTFADFKTAVLAHYPDATDDFVFSIGELEAHIAKHRKAGIATTDNLDEYNRSYLAITTWLIEKDQMGEFEQRRDYIRAFTEPLLGRIKARLSMKFLDQHPNKPHKIQDIYEAARHVLLGETAFPQSTHVPVPASVAAVRISPAAPLDSSIPAVIKAETFASVMSDFTKTITEAFQQGNRSRISAPMSSAPRNTDCNFCGGPHFIRECTVVDEYVVAGKIRRNFEGKVILSTGAFVPRDIPGTLLSERVDEWHHRNPNQLSVASLIHTISAEHVREHTPVVTQPAFQLSTADRITTLEAELFNLRARRSSFVPVVKTRAQKARELPLASIEEVPEDEPVEQAREPTPQITIATPKPPVITQNPAIVITPQPSVEPEHPFRNAKDAAYAPPTSRNVGAPVKVPANKAVIPANKAVIPAYKTLPPIHEASIAMDLYKRAMEAPITITQRELLSLSPEVRAQVRDVTTTHRIPTAAASTTQGSLQIAISEEDIAFDIAQTFALRRTDERIPPKGAIVVADPIEEYYGSLEPGEIPSIDRLTVAKESTAIRSIYALVDNSQKKECTVDPGCQVIRRPATAWHCLTTLGFA
jgi:hypothetical protein